MNTGHEAAECRARRGLAWVSVVLGVVGSLGLGPLAGIPAVVGGHVAYSRARRHPERYRGAGLAMTGLVLGYLSLFLGTALLLQIVGTALPHLMNPAGRTQETECRGQLVLLGRAFQGFAGAHPDRWPAEIQDLAPFAGNPALLACPADTAREAMAGTNWSGLKEVNVSYLYSAPKADPAAADPGTILVRCPVHGLVLRADGSVERPPPRRPKAGGG